MDASRLTDHDPVQLGSWKVLSRLGEGGMGAVYLGERAGRWAALKTLHPHIASDARASERFQREYLAACNVKSPFVAEIVEADFSNARPFLAIEYMTGPTLDDFIDGNGPLSGPELAQFGHKLGSGIRAIHTVSVTHRDIKPSNVIMTGRGPVLIDFGIALLGENSDLTATNHFVGSPRWAAPEQLTGDVVAAPADVFGWGALMQFVATGRHPFGSGTAHALMYRIAHGSPMPHRVDGAIGDMITRSLDRDPRRRPRIDEILAATSPAFGSGLPMVVAHNATVSTEPGLPAAASSVRGLRTVWREATILAAVVAMAAVVFVLWQASREARPFLNQNSAASAAEPEGAAASAGSPDRADPSTDDASAPDGAAFSSPETAVVAVPSYVSMGLKVGCESGAPVSLEQAHEWSVKPGDVIELERGCAFVGPFRVVASGSAEQRITITSSPGEGPGPTITNRPVDRVGSIIKLEGSHLTVRDLALVARTDQVVDRCATSDAGWVVGVEIDDGMSGNHIERISVTGGYAGVHIGPGASDNSITDSVFVANTMLNDVSGANAIEIFGDRNQVLGNRFSNHAACGEGAAVEVYGGSHNTIVGNSSVDDLTVVELNGGPSENTPGTQIRRNVAASNVEGSSFVALRAARIEGSPTEVSHNTAVLSGQDVAGLRCDRTCVAEETVFANNIVIASVATAGDGNYSGGSNLFWATDVTPFEAIEVVTTARHSRDGNLVADPMLNGLDGGSFEPGACSPAIDVADAALSTSDEQDYAGTRLPVGSELDIGAVEALDVECGS